MAGEGLEHVVCLLDVLLGCWGHLTFHGGKFRTDFSKEVVTISAGEVPAHCVGSADRLDLVDEFPRDVPLGAQHRLVDCGDVLAGDGRYRVDDPAGEIGQNRESAVFRVWLLSA